MGRGGDGGRRQALPTITAQLEQWSEMALTPEQFALVQQLRALKGLFDEMSSSDSDYFGDEAPVKAVTAKLLTQMEQLTKELSTQL